MSHIVEMMLTSQSLNRTDLTPIHGTMMRFAPIGSTLVFPIQFLVLQVKKLIM